MVSQKQKILNSPWGNVLLMLIVAILIIALAEAKKVHELKTELIVLEMQLDRKEESATNVYNKLQTNLDKAQDFQDEVEVDSESALKSIVCSEANYYNNKTQKALKKYKKSLKKAKKYLTEYKLRYKDAKELEREINEIENKLNLKTLSKTTLNYYKKECDEFASLYKEKSTVIKNAKSAQRYADKLYLEYKELMERIVAGECGSKYCSDKDQIYVMQVIENRILHPDFPDTVEEVIFQPGQYQPTWDGNWNKKVDKRTRENVRAYLRGEVQTGMPRNVVYQAMFKQGDYVWAYVPNSVDGGHYYCGVYEE